MSTASVPTGATLAAIGNAFLNAVPGQYYWNQALSYFEQGSIGWGIAYTGAMLADQFLAVVTFGASYYAEEAATTGVVRLADDTLVCRGGTCSAERFARGSGVTIDEAGRLRGVSVNSAPGATLNDLTTTIPNTQVGVTTVGEVRAAGGEVIPSGSAPNPYHCTMCGVTPQQAERLFTPTVRNPNVP
jgi:hypothetical protein